MSEKIKKLFMLWFSLSLPVTRKSYVTSGIFLMVLKYGLDWLLIEYYTGQFLSPLSYLAPVLELRSNYFQGVPSYVPLIMVTYTLPFMWIGLTMSVRRSVNAGYSPWSGLFFLIPFLNYVAMLLLAVLPNRPHLRENSRHDPSPENDQASSKLSAALKGIAISVTITMISVIVSVYFIGEYSAAIFIGLPLFIGIFSAYFFNRPIVLSLRQSTFVAFTSVFITGLSLLLFGIEGAICILMALPIAVFLSLLGAVIGFRFAQWKHTSSLNVFVGFLVIPLWMGMASIEKPLQEYKVTSSVIVSAPIHKVWEMVVQFPEITDPPRGLFKFGVAYPMRAYIDGTGVGSIRHCEFSTGSFVEPITAWNSPSLLSFDVISQPDAMKEMSPYKSIKAPHLKDSFRSVRGEFRLTDLGHKKTLLEGSTWYVLEVFPITYWQVWTDYLVHKIHDRVLSHIKKKTEDKLQASISEGVM